MQQLGVFRLLSDALQLDHHSAFMRSSPADPATTSVHGPWRVNNTRTKCKAKKEP